MLRFAMVILLFLLILDALLLANVHFLLNIIEEIHLKVSHTVKYNQCLYNIVDLYITNIILHIVYVILNMYSILHTQYVLVHRMYLVQ